MTNDQRKLVLVVDTDQRFVDDLRLQLTSHRVLSARDLDEAREIVLGGRVDLALLGPAYASDVAVNSARTLFEADPFLEVALAADVVTNRLLKAALRGGFVDVLDTPVSARDLDEVIRQITSRPSHEMSFDVEPMNPVEVAPVPVAQVPPVVSTRPVLAVPPVVQAPPVAEAPQLHEAAPTPQMPPAFEPAPVAVVPQVYEAPPVVATPPMAVPPPVIQAAVPPQPAPVAAAPAPQPVAPPAMTPVAPIHEPFAPPGAPRTTVTAGETDSFSTAAEVSFTAAPVTPPAAAPSPAPEAMVPPMHFEVAPSGEPTPALLVPDLVAPQVPPPQTPPPQIPPPMTPVTAPEPVYPTTPPWPSEVPTVPASAPPIEFSESVDSAPQESKTAVLDQVLPPPPAMPPPLPAPPSVRPASFANSPRPTVTRSGPGKVIAVMAGKGGSGKTVTATNLAIAIGMRSNPERVAIVDADLQFGDVALLLQLDPVRTLDDIVGHVDGMSDERLDAALLRHESGIRVLPAPLLPVRAGEISAKSVVEIVDRLRSLYDTIVVDTGPVFDDGLITMLEHADQVITVVDMDLPSVKNAKVALDGLRQIGFDMDRIRLVVNRANSKARLDLVELERSLGLRVGGSIPSDRLVPQSVNEGIPVLALSPRSKVARAFHALAESLDSGADRERMTAR